MEGGGGPDHSNGTTPPSISLEVTPDVSPQPVWAFDGMPPGTNVTYSLNADGSRAAVTTYSEGEPLNIVQLDTTTGEPTEPTSVGPLSPDPSSEPLMRFSDGNLVVIQTGEVASEGTQRGGPGLSVTVVSAAGEIIAESTELLPKDSFGMKRTFPTLLPGDVPVLAFTDRDELFDDTSNDTPPLTVTIDPHTAATSVKWREEVESANCATAEPCTHFTLPLAATGSSTLTAHHEKVSLHRPCDSFSKDGSHLPPEDPGCFSGFGTTEWVSEEIALANVQADHGHLTGIGPHHVMGTWGTGNDDFVTALIDIEKGDVLATADCMPAWNEEHYATITTDPSTQYVIAGTARFSLSTGEGECFNSTDTALPLYLQNIAADGSAWGLTTKPSTTSPGDAEPVMVTVDGTSSSAEPGRPIAIGYSPDGLALVPIDDAPDAGYAGLAGSERIG